MKILVIGGYGVFGGRLARLLMRDGHDVYVAGRSIARAESFCAEHGGTPVPLDLSDDARLTEALTRHRPELVIDAAGPFQAYRDAPYRVASAAIDHGIHYMDLSDDTDFCAGIARLNRRATEKGVVALSGVSSVPALSGAIADKLTDGICKVEMIDTAILPGNKAPRGRSVMSAILSQVGAPIAQWRGGHWTSAAGWSGRKAVTLAPDLTRPTSVIGAPDLALFPQAFRARSVQFRAGLELPVMNGGLRALGWLRQRHILPPLEKLTRPLHWVSERLENMGTDRGGMAVTIGGRDERDRPLQRKWTLVAEKGEGPFVPAVAARLLAAKLARSEVAAGARPAIREFSLEEAEAAMSDLSVTTHRNSHTVPRVFEEALGVRWARIPEPIRRIHDVWDLNTATGEARVIRGTNPIARLVAILFRFPPDADFTPVTVTMESHGREERWTRQFGRHRFRSTLRYSRPAHVIEKFGPCQFELYLPVEKGGMGMAVTRGWMFGIPIPSWLLPVSDTREYTYKGCFHFDVRLSAPLIGRIVQYQGWLRPE